MLFARSDIAQQVAHIGDSLAHERSWHVLHSNRGPILLGLWYRPPAQGEVQSIMDLEGELGEFSADTIGVAVFGDINVHHKPWLEYSRSITREGKSLFDVCCRCGLVECVRAPTRGAYLLDLFLADLPSDVCSVVLPGISDHNLVFSRLDAQIPAALTVQRECFVFTQADWQSLNIALLKTNWAFVCSLPPSIAAEKLTDTILEKAKAHIPFQTKQVPRGCHPWINEKCRQLIADKIAAYGTPSYERKRDLCSQGLYNSYSQFLSGTKDRIHKHPSSSKHWWHLSRRLLSRACPTSSIPPIKEEHGNWVVDPYLKAELFSKSFRAKSVLPPPATRTPTVNLSDTSGQMCGFLPVRARRAEQILRHLREDSPTGPDTLPAKILKRCARSLALPVALLTRSVLRTGTWPEGWKLHWVFPLFKKKSPAKTANYRGIHLTAQLSKVTERLLASLAQPFLEKTVAYGPNALDTDQIVALYCSDVSGAFDRVPTEKLLQKLRAKGLHPLIVNLFASWLSPRKALVIVDGWRSAPATLENSVFQGTLLGPMLWNCFYEDARMAVNRNGFQETVFADDLNAYRFFNSNVPARVIWDELKACQASLHVWGEDNQVVFDAGKESFHLLHPSNPQGQCFKLLGVTFDLKLHMDLACYEIAAEAGWRVRAILRCRPFYDCVSLLALYKAQVLSYIEFRTAAIYHAPDFFLHAVDKVQDNFLNEIGLTPETALLQYNLSPLRTRRDIAMLGLIFRVAKGLAPLQFE